MVASLTLRKNKQGPLTWDEMDSNLEALRDAPGIPGPPGVQGPAGTTGPAAESALSCILSNDSYVFPASTDGVVPISGYVGANTSVLIILGILDDTHNWTLSIVNSAGVTAALDPITATVTVTSFDTAIDAGTITITANRIGGGGYPTLTRVFSLSKVKAGADGAEGTPGTAGPAADASVSALLSSEAYVFPASITGNIAAADFTPATTTMMVVLGVTDDSSHWTFSKVDSVGITSTITGNVVKVTAMPDTTNTGSVTISATRVGYPTLKRVFDLSKAKAGAIGPNGTTGPQGPTGPVGSSGVAGIRGSRTFYIPVTVSTWNDSQASSTASVSGGPVLNDTVVQYNAASGFVETRFWTGSAWAIVNVVINGNLLVDGTIGAQKLVANTITANSGVIAAAAIGTLTLAGNAVTQAIALQQIGVGTATGGGINGTGGLPVGYQINVVPTATNGTTVTTTNYTTVATLSGVSITGTQPIMIWGTAGIIGLHATGTGNPPDASDSTASHTETYAGFTWISNKRNTWFLSQVVFTHTDGTQYITQAGDGIIVPAATSNIPLSAFLPTIKAGSYTVQYQVKVDTDAGFTAAGTPIEGVAVRQTKLIILETKR